MTLDLAARMRIRELSRKETLDRSDYMFTKIFELKVGEICKIEDYFGNWHNIVPHSIEQLSQTTVRVIDELGSTFRLLNA